MPHRIRFTVHSTPGHRFQKHELGLVQESLRKVIRKSNAPSVAATVCYVSDDPRGMHATTDCVDPASFVSLACSTRYVPSLLQQLQKLNISYHLEITSLNSLFITGGQIKSGEWKDLLRQELLLKTTIVRHLGILHPDNLKLFLQQQDVTPEEIKRAMLKIKLVVRKEIFTLSRAKEQVGYFYPDFEKKITDLMDNSLAHLAILAGIC